MITPESLATIRILWRRDDCLSLYGIPYDMRPGQSPSDIYYGRRERDLTARNLGATRSAPGPGQGWIWLGCPGWFGGMSSAEVSLVKAFLAQHKDRVPGGPREWDTLARPRSVP